ncbi:hypothetical protein AB4205_22745, partial [Vibrio sp. 10N.286.49.F3]|uniref:hypothetical protein n=1 Tax=Vibrio sp. 10N.286.49.F3 TaxID=3229704 RepID=UPI0035518D06
SWGGYSTSVVFREQLHTIVHRKFGKFSENQLRMFYSVLSNTEPHFCPLILQTDFVSQIKELISTHRHIYQIHAFDLNLSILFFFRDEKMYILDVVDLSTLGLEKLGKVYNIKALDDPKLRRDLECARYIQSDKISKRLEKLIKLIWKSGTQMVCFALSKSSCKNLECVLANIPGYEDHDFVGAWFSKVHYSD